MMLVDTFSSSLRLQCLFYAVDDCAINEWRDIPNVRTEHKDPSKCNSDWNMVISKSSGLLSCAVLALL